MRLSKILANEGTSRLLLFVFLIDLLDVVSRIGDFFKRPLTTNHLSDVNSLSLFIILIEEMSGYTALFIENILTVAGDAKLSFYFVVLRLISALCRGHGLKFKLRSALHLLLDNFYGALYSPLCLSQALFICLCGPCKLSFRG